MKIVHVSVFRQVSPGQRMQLKFEAQAAAQLAGGTWETLVLHAGDPVEDFERRIPLLFRPMFLRTLYAWLLMLKLSGRYDVILCRHMTFDPFALLFAWFVRNRATVHHAKEIQELLLIRAGVPGRLASRLERLTGDVSTRTALAIIGVTDEIRKYQLSIREMEKPSHVYPNGIYFPGFQAAADHRSADTVNAVFICESFAPWHGLDLLIDAANAYENRAEARKLKIHLIGGLTDEQVGQIRSANQVNDIFVMHGVLPASDYAPIMSLCDIGIGSLALYRKDLDEAATLKVREYLAIGLPVYSGHKDTAIPADFEYYVHDECSLDKILRFGFNAKRASRQAVRMASRPFVDKAAILQDTMNWLADEIATGNRVFQVGHQD